MNAFGKKSANLVSVQNLKRMSHQVRSANNFKRKQIIARFETLTEHGPIANTAMLI